MYNICFNLGIWPELHGGQCAPEYRGRQVALPIGLEPEAHRTSDPTPFHFTVTALGLQRDRLSAQISAMWPENISEELAYVLQSPPKENPTGK